MVARNTKLRVEGHYEFDQELRTKLAATRRKAAEEDQESEEEGRNWTSVSCEPRMNGMAGSSSGQITESERQAL